MLCCECASIPTDLTPIRWTFSLMFDVHKGWVLTLDPQLSWTLPTAQDVPGPAYSAGDEQRSPFHLGRDLRHSDFT